MATRTAKKGKTKQVRIRPESKERLQKVMFKKTAKENRVVTEVELTSAAVDQFCDREEKKLGL